MIRTFRLFSSLTVKKNPSFLRSINGEVVSYPKNAVNAYGERPIAAVGANAIQMAADESHPADALRNIAKMNYLVLRNKLIDEHRGCWLVASSNVKSMVVVEHEAVAESVGETLFRSNTEDYFIGCLGSEVISQAHMGNMTLAGGQGTEQEDWATAVYIDGEYSLDNGRSFQNQRMKFDTGASMMGVPKTITSEHTLQRGPDVYYIGPDGRATLANTYKNVVIRVAGLPITTRIIECRTWLLGHDVYKHFITTVDTDSTPPVIMIPRAAA